MSKRKFFIKAIGVYISILLLLSVVRSWMLHESFFSVYTETIMWCSGIGLSLFVIFFPPLFLLRTYWRKQKAKRNMESDQQAKVIDRFMRNTPAMLGAITIVYAVLVALFAHWLAPDRSPYAGDQINELAYKGPGFQCEVLLVPVELQPEPTGWLHALLFGKPSQLHTIPITDHQFIGDSLKVTRYIGEGIKGLTLRFALSDLTDAARERSAQIHEIEKHHLKHRTFWLGTDDLGRDFLSRILLGTRVSLSVGIVAVIIALFIGIPLGAIAGYYKRYPPQIRLFKQMKWRLPVDNAVMWFINIIWSIPTLLLVFPIVFAFGQQFYTIFIAVGLTMWVDIARMVRGQVMQVREMEFVQATRTFGFSDSRAIWRHIIPNITGPVIVITAANFAYAILTEAGLSFLGIGVQPPAPSWGLMIAKYKDNLITDPYLALIPGFAITLLVLAFFMVGNGLRDALDIKSRL